MPRRRTNARVDALRRLANYPITIGGTYPGLEEGNRVFATFEPGEEEPVEVPAFRFNEQHEFEDQVALSGLPAPMDTTRNDVTQANIQRLTTGNNQRAATYLRLEVFPRLGIDPTFITQKLAATRAYRERVAGILEAMRADPDIITLRRILRELDFAQEYARVNNGEPLTFGPDNVNKQIAALLTMRETVARNQIVGPRVFTVSGQVRAGDEGDQETEQRTIHMMVGANSIRNSTSLAVFLLTGNFDQARYLPGMHLEHHGSDRAALLWVPETITLSFEAYRMRTRSRTRAMVRRNGERIQVPRGGRGLDRNGRRIGGSFFPWWLRTTVPLDLSILQVNKEKRVSPAEDEFESRCMEDIFAAALDPDCRKTVGVTKMLVETSPDCFLYSSLVFLRMIIADRCDKPADVDIIYHELTDSYFGGASPWIPSSAISKIASRTGIAFCVKRYTAEHRLNSEAKSSIFPCDEEKWCAFSKDRGTICIGRVENHYVYDGTFPVTYWFIENMEELTQLAKKTGTPITAYHFAYKWKITHKKPKIYGGKKAVVELINSGKWNDIHERVRYALKIEESERKAWEKDRKKGRKNSPFHTGGSLLATLFYEGYVPPPASAEGEEGEEESSKKRKRTDTGKYESPAALNDIGCEKYFVPMNSFEVLNYLDMNCYFKDALETRLLPAVQDHLLYELFEKTSRPNRPKMQRPALKIGKASKFYTPPPVPEEDECMDDDDGPLPWENTEEGSRVRFNFIRHDVDEATARQCRRDRARARRMEREDDGEESDEPYDARERRPRRNYRKELAEDNSRWPLSKIIALSQGEGGFEYNEPKACILINQLSNINEHRFIKYTPQFLKDIDLGNKEYFWPPRASFKPQNPFVRLCIAPLPMSSADKKTVYESLGEPEDTFEHIITDQIRDEHGRLLTWMEKQQLRAKKRAAAALLKKKQEEERRQEANKRRDFASFSIETHYTPVAFDFETVTDTAVHIPFLVAIAWYVLVGNADYPWSAATSQGAVPDPEKWEIRSECFSGWDCAQKLCDFMTDHFRKIDVLMLAFNLRYDFGMFLRGASMDPTGGVFRSASRANSATALLYHSTDVEKKFPKIVRYLDAIPFLPPNTRLSDFGKMFSLPMEKEILPYAAYGVSQANMYFSEADGRDTDEAVMSFDITNRKKVSMSISTAAYFHIMASMDEAEKEIISQEALLAKVLAYCVELEAAVNRAGAGYTLQVDTPEGPVLDKRFFPMRYAKYYCVRDCEVLLRAFLAHRQALYNVKNARTGEPCGIDIFHCCSIPQFANMYLEQSGAYEDVFSFSGTLRGYCQSAVVGGRVMTADNLPLFVLGPIADSDVNSLYPTAMLRISEEAGGFPLGIPRPFQGMPDCDDGLDAPFIHYYIMSVKITGYATKRSFSVLSYKDEEGKRCWDADGLIGRTITVDKIGWEDAQRFQGFTGEIISGVYFVKHDAEEKEAQRQKIYMKKTTPCDKKHSLADASKKEGGCKRCLRYYDLLERARAAGFATVEEYAPLPPPCATIGECMVLLKKWRDGAATKAEEKAIKLIMNGAYGRTIMKALKTMMEFICGKEAIEKFMDHNYMEVEDFVNPREDVLIATKTKSINDHYARPHVGAMILSMSKRIMNEAMCLAEDIGIPIYYQDTDSMQLSEHNVPRLAAAYKEKYGRELYGEALGQFSSDWETPPGYIKEKTVGVMGYYFAKKFYAVLLKLTPEDPSVKQLHYKWHIRTKGIPAGCIERQAKLMTPDKDEVDAVAYFLEDIARNKTVTMDLLLGGTKTRFESNKDFSTSSKRKFTRDVSIKEEMRRYKDVDGKLGEIRLSA